MQSVSGQYLKGVATCAGAQLPGSSLAELFPKALAARAERVWRASVQTAARSSKLQEDVSRVLWSLGVSHKNSEVTSDGLFCVDIALEGENVRPSGYNDSPSTPSCIMLRHCPSEIQCQQLLKRIRQAWHVPPRPLH